MPTATPSTLVDSHHSLHPSLQSSATPPASSTPDFVTEEARLAHLVGAALRREGYVDDVQLAYAQQKQRVSGSPLWRVVIGEGLARESDVVRVLSQAMQVQFVDVEALTPPSTQVLALFNKDQCAHARFLPLAIEGRQLVILLGDTLPQQVAQLVRQRTSLSCRFVMGSFTLVAQLIRNTYYFALNPPEQLLEREVARLANDTDHVVAPDKMLEHLLHLAVRERATDIHLTSGPMGLHVLFRIDGVLQPIRALPTTLARLLGFIKIAAEMDISEQRRPQDGSFRATVLEEQIAIRVSTIVTEHGERMVLRLLPEAHEIKDLGGLGYFPEDVSAISKAMAAPAGLILITGPTGSGKSSTLHAGLRMQHLIERNVLTVEDPLEYRVPLAGQTQVNRRAGYNFDTALRHFLRHDPDVILVGEMRDAETAQAALDAAATGHLVLSTLHVTSVFGVVSRLTPLGLVSQVIAENLKLVINQRLVRRLCPHCAKPQRFTPVELRWLQVADGAEGRRAVGCDRCRGTGYHGRLPLYELLFVDEDMANAIADGAGREAVRQLAQRQGFRPIGAVARRRVACGETTVSEVIRVLGEGPEHIGSVDRLSTSVDRSAITREQSPALGWPWLNPDAQAPELPGSRSLTGTLYCEGFRTTRA